MAALSAVFASCLATDGLGAPQIANGRRELGVIFVSNGSGGPPPSQVGRYEKFEIALHVTGRAFDRRGQPTEPAPPTRNPYMPFDPEPLPGIPEGINVDLLLIPPGTAEPRTVDGWRDTALRAPCFYFRPYDAETLSPRAAEAWTLQAAVDWRCRFAPEVTAEWRYRILVEDRDGSVLEPSIESEAHRFHCRESGSPGFVRVSRTDPRFFEHTDGTPFREPLINTETGNPPNSRERIRSTIPDLARKGIRFVRWFPTEQGANWNLVPFAGSVNPTWGFHGDIRFAESEDRPIKGWVSTDRISFLPHYRSEYLRIPQGEGILGAGQAHKFSIDLRASSRSSNEIDHPVLRLEIESLPENTGDSPVLLTYDLCFGHETSPPYHLRNGSGGRQLYEVIELSGQLGDTGNGLGISRISVPDILNPSPHGDRMLASGIALVDEAGEVRDFISFGGVLTPEHGAAAGHTSRAIGASQSNRTPPGTSLQLDDRGQWNLHPRTFGEAKPDQKRPIDGEVFINEVHYNNSHTRDRHNAWIGDVGEGVELVAASGTSLDGWRLELYSAAAGIRALDKCDHIAPPDAVDEIGLFATIRSEGARLRVRGLYTTSNRVDGGGADEYRDSHVPQPYNRPKGDIALHSIALRPIADDGRVGLNLLGRSNPDTLRYVDPVAAAQLDELFRLSEQHGVFHKLPLFRKQDSLLSCFDSAGRLNAASCSTENFYENPWAQRLRDAYIRYFVARWSYSTALHSLEIANENPASDDPAAPGNAAALRFADTVNRLSPRKVLISNSFDRHFPLGFWKDPRMDYADLHRYACEDCNDSGTSELWRDSAAYVRECARTIGRIRLGKPIVRGEGGVWQRQGVPHPSLYRDSGAHTDVYFHKKLWAQLGVLGAGCDGEWYANLAGRKDGWPSFRAYSAFADSEAVPRSLTAAAIGSDLAEREAIEVVPIEGPADDLRAWGRRWIDREGTSRYASIWVDHAQHTWHSIVTGTAGDRVPITADLRVGGFAPGDYETLWWDTHRGQALGKPSRLQAVDGTVVVRVTNLNDDRALRITPAHRRGDLDLTR